jgi:hypothetical protein
MVPGAPAGPAGPAIPAGPVAPLSPFEQETKNNVIAKAKSVRKIFFFISENCDVLEWV